MPKSTKSTKKKTKLGTNSSYENYSVKPKPLPIPKKSKRVAADSVQEQKEITYGEFIKGDKTDFARIKKEANSEGMQQRILARNKALYGQMQSGVTDALKGLTAEEKKKRLKEIRKARIELSDGTGYRKKFKHIIDVIDPLPVSLDDNKPSSDEVALAKSSPSIQLKAAAMNNTPTSTTNRTYTDSTLGEKMQKLYGPKWKDKIDDRFEDPYSEKDKWRWHDGFRVDGSAQVSLEVRSEFVLGAEYTKTSLDTNKEFGDDSDAEGKDVARIQKVPLYKWFKRMCDKFDKTCKLNYWGQGGLIQHWQYGRAALVIQDDKRGFPIALKLLNSMRLGRVFVEVLTWKVVAIEYIDWAPPENIILAENMIYLVNKNFHSSPGSLWYGLSDYEPIRDLLETNILIESIDIKEINKRLWAAMILIKVFSEDEEAISALRMALKSGRSVFSTLDFESDQLKIEHDLPALLQERKDNREKIYGDLQVPRVVALGDTDALAKATASIAAHAWNAGPLKKHKLLTRTNFEEQWYDRNMLRLAKHRAKILKITPEDIQKHKEEMEAEEEKDIEYEMKEPKDEKELLIHLLSMPVADWPFRLKMITTNIDFSTPIEKAALASTLVASQIIDNTKALDIMDYKDVIERMKADKQLDGQTTAVVKSLFDGGTDPASLDVPTLLSLLIAAMRKGSMQGNGDNKIGDKTTAAQPGVGGEKTTVPTLETIRKGIENKAKSGLGSKPSDIMKRVLNKTKMPSAPSGVSSQ